MTRRTSRLIPAAIAAVLVLGACGATEDAVPSPASESEMRAPVPIEIAAGGGGAAETSAAADEAATSDMRIGPVFRTEFELTDGLVAPTDDTGYVFDATATASAEDVARIASALGVEGEPVRIEEEWGVSWRVGPDDGSAPSLFLQEDSQLYWNYSAAWAGRDEGVACVSVAESSGLDEPTTDDAVADEPAIDEPIIDEPAVEDCPAPEPPAGVPTADEAEARARELLTAIGIDPDALKITSDGGEWSANVYAEDTTDGRATLRSWNFGFGGDGVLEYAGGQLAAPAPVGPYPLVDIETAFARLQEQSFGWFDDLARGGAEPGIAVAEPMPIEGDAPVDEVLVDPAVEEPIEPETVVVRLVDVQADLWWAWDVNGTAWLLPAYRFIGDDGGWYTVPAVTDEFLIQVDPPVAIEEPVEEPVEEPLPVEPDGGDGSGAEPLPSVAPDALAPLVGAPLADFSAKAGEGGWTVRVVEQDGQGLDVTADFRTDRINVAVQTLDGVGYVVMATLDDGTLIGEATLPDAGEPPATTPAPVEDAAALLGVHDDVAFYPACGDETLEFDGRTWSQIQPSDYPELYEAATTAEREQAPDVSVKVNGLLRVAEPGPGDDVGTLLVWSDDVAYFVSDSGDLTTWLTTQQLEYPWAC